MWVVLVATGTAQTVLNFILRLHFIELDIQGAMLVGITFAIGAVFGLVFAYVWNWLAGSATLNEPADGSARQKA